MITAINIIFMLVHGMPILLTTSTIGKHFALCQWLSVQP